MDNKRCSYCGSPQVKYIPAGFSRVKNKNYSAFYACQDCGKTESANSTQVQPVKNPPPKKEVVASANDKFESVMTYLEQILIIAQEISEELKKRNN